MHSTQKIRSAYASVRGFRLAGIASGIKKDEALDLALIVADEEVATAAVFTRNVVKAAPVVLSASRLGVRKSARAILVNSGNANVCTGPDGEAAAQRMTQRLATELDIAPESVLVASTGVIGVPLPIDAIEKAVPSLVQELSPQGSADFAHAILTTDKGTKTSRFRFQVGETKYTVAAFAKGAGMIHPDMATTLAFVLTDAPVDQATLQPLLSDATDRTFNRITVDGDTSTNDSIFLMASGAAGGEPIREGKPLQELAQAIHIVLEQVALRIVADGEGAEHCVRISVAGAVDEGSALRVARTIATSQLVKTAIHGCDPNWGRVLGAAGRAGVALDHSKAALYVGDVCVFRDGVTTMDAKTEKKASRVMRENAYEIRLVLQEGKAEAHYWTCDLGHEYVRINADYRS